MMLMIKEEEEMEVKNELIQTGIYNLNKKLCIIYLLPNHLNNKWISTNSFEKGECVQDKEC